VTPARVLVVVAVGAEREAVLAGSDAYEVVVTGVGTAAAAAGTARALALAEAAGRPYTAVLSAGIGGGFAGRVDIGDLVLADRCVAADLGAESPDGFLALDALGFGTATLDTDPALLAGWRAASPDAVVGTVLTVNTVTGTASGAQTLAGRHPEAVAEAMEGFGAATAATQAGVPFAEVRTISNLVGPRDRGSWRIGVALKTLAVAFSSTGKNG
jgi:futalosine hydrolase